MKTKIYLKWEIPTNIVLIVKSICADYERRAKVIALAKADGAVIEKYKELNDAIDKALEDVEPGIRKSLLKDFVEHLGYDRSGATFILSKNAYYRRKRKMIRDIAHYLNLI